jgi:uncharacterized membrane protein YraQ (UPF0718 family)
LLRSAAGFIFAVAAYIIWRSVGRIWPLCAMATAPACYRAAVADAVHDGGVARRSRARYIAACAPRCCLMHRAYYLAFGLTLAIAAGWVIGRLHLESWLEPWVRDIRVGAVSLPSRTLTAVDRIKAGIEAVRDIVGKVWPWMIAGIAAGAAIHGYAPAELLAAVMGKDSWWSVPAAVVIGIPMYSNAAGIIPVVEALLGKGAALGTVLAFMMAVTALSLPEFIILRKVLTPRLLAVFVGVVGSGILAVGFLFNALFS